MITGIELSGYIPLMTGGVKHIIANTREQVNIIIGYNGSGKSNLVKELNPFPPDSSKFIDGGMKKITLINDEGKTIVCTSVMGKEGYHHFEVDGVNLNNGCTATAQRMLAEQYFGMNQMCSRILSGLHITEMFNVMSPAKRKDFLMDLYPNDTTYGMNVYTKLKEEFNNLRGALKNQITRYAIEKQTLETLNKISENDLLLKIDALDNEIKEGLYLSGQLAGGVQHGNLQFNHDKLLGIAKRLVTLQIVNPRGMTRNNVKAEIENMEGSVRLYKSKLHYYTNQLAELTQQVSLQDLKQDPKTLERRIALLTQNYTQQLDIKLGLVNVLTEHTTLMEAHTEFGNEFVSALEELRDYVLRVSISSTPELTRQQYQGWVERRDMLGNRLTKTKDLLESKQHKLNHYLGTADINCPKCDHHFKVGISDQDIKLLQSEVEGLTKQVEGLTGSISDLDKLIENDRDWFNTMQALYRWLSQQRYTIADLSKLIREYDVGKKECDGFINAINNLVRYADVEHRMQMINNEKGLLESHLGLLKQNYIGGVIEKIKSTEESIAWYTNCMRLMNKKLTVNTALLGMMQDYDQLLIQFKEQFSIFKQHIKEDFQYQLKHEVDKDTHARSNERTQLMSEIIRNKSANSVVESIDKDIVRLKRRIKIVKGLMDGLCPNKGLIGRLMLDFIKTFCGNANAIIKEFCNITLLLKPCNKDNGDLTYRFPVINGQDTEASDISECSNGESEILNWVIRKVGMRYKPKWYPLFMDEVGAFLDEINRTKFFEYIQRIMADKDHEQMFMISHYVAQHGIFHNPNIIALKHEGLTVNGLVNTNTTIHRV